MLLAQCTCSCDPGSVSIERQGQGVFTTELLRYMGQPVPLQLMALDVKRAVLATNLQRCWFNDA